MDSLANNIKSLQTELKEHCNGHLTSSVPIVSHETRKNTSLTEQDALDTLENHDESIVSIEEFIDSELQPSQVLLNFLPPTTQQ